MNISQYFEKTKHGFKPFAYQREVAELILNGENVILQAPTGAGKTLAAIMPFIIAREEGLEFPQKLIYSTPRRTLVNSLYEDIYKEINEGKFSSNFNITIQTGKRNEDRFFNGDIIFTTFDQSLSSALSIPVSLSNRLGNINVAAVLSSHLIFDEFHLFEPDASSPTTVLLLEKLQGKTPFCIMTATLSDKKTEYLSKKLDAKIIKADSREYLSDIVTQKGKERRVYIHSEDNIEGKEIVKLHNSIQDPNGGDSKKSIIMCNRVDNAQQIYRDILTHANTEETEVLLIHSRFLEGDRKKKEEKIKKLFSKDKTSNAILVTSQVIEVGIDITSHVMHTEISPIDSFLQRIGRCARYQNEKGSIYVYQPLNEGRQRYLPYNNEATLKTLEALKVIDGQVLTANISQKIINKVYSEETDIDKKEIEKVEYNRGDFVLECWKRPDKKRFKELVRNIVGCNIIIAENIRDNISPYNYQSISISPRTLKGKIAKMAEETDEWLIKEVIETNRNDESQYKYQQISAGNIYPNTLYILNPDYFAYDQTMGLLFNRKSDYRFKPLEYRKREPEFNADYPEEDYLDHIKSIKREVSELKNELKYGINLIKKEFSLSSKDIENIIEFIIWAHDLGKLQVEWQLAHKKEQYDFIAHGKRLRKPPGHAAESFWIVYNLLDLFVGDFLRTDDYIFEVIGKSIVSHHYPVVDETDSYKLLPVVKDYLFSRTKDFFTFEDTADFISNNIEELLLIQRARESIFDELEMNDIRCFYSYFILVRLLRLADQQATKKLTEKGGK